MLQVFLQVAETAVAVHAVAVVERLSRRFGLQDNVVKQLGNLIHQLCMFGGRLLGRSGCSSDGRSLGIGLSLLCLCLHLSLRLELRLDLSLGLCPCLCLHLCLHLGVCLQLSLSLGLGVDLRLSRRLSLGLCLCLRLCLRLHLSLSLCVALRLGVGHVEGRDRDSLHVHGKRLHCQAWVVSHAVGSGSMMRGAKRSLGWAGVADISSSFCEGAEGHPNDCRLSAEAGIECCGMDWDAI